MLQPLQQFFINDLSRYMFAAQFAVTHDITLNRKRTLHLRDHLGR